MKQKQNNKKIIASTLSATLVVAAFFVISPAFANSDTSTGLVGYWNLDENIGFIPKDSSGNGNNGYLNNGANWAVGKHGRSVMFDGIDDSISISDSSVFDFGEGEFSVSAWVFVDSFNNAIFFGKYGKVGNGWRVLTRANGWVTFEGNDDERSTEKPVLVAQQWQHIAIVRSADSITFYIDGNLVNSDTALPGSFDNDIQFTIATTSKPPVGGCCQKYFKGLVDDLRIYSRALSSEDVTALYTQIPGAITSSPAPAPGPIIGDGDSVSPDEQEPVASPGLLANHPDGTLINDNGTIYLIKDRKRLGFRNPQEYASHGYRFDQAVPAVEGDLKLPLAPSSFARALDGTLALDKTDNRTIYMIAGGMKRGFTSAQVFQNLGYKFDQAIAIDLSDYPADSPIENATAAHPNGALVLDKNDKRTVWWILNGQRQGFESVEVFNTYGFNFEKIVPANDADMALPEGPLVKFRDGTLVRQNSDYFIISQGQKRKFQDADHLVNNGYKLANVIDANLDSYVEGENVKL